jgi:hypothetical protein
LQPVIAWGFLTLSALAVVRPGAAWGQDGGTSSLVAEDFFIGVQATMRSNLSDFEAARIFNQANCQCERPMWVFVSLSQQGFTKTASLRRGSGRVALGAKGDCLDPILRPNRCIDIGGDFLLNELVTKRGIYVETTARQLSALPAGIADGGTTADPCDPSTERTQGINILVDQEPDGTFNFAQTRDIRVDLKPPPPPTDVVATPGHQALVVSWTGIDTQSVFDLLHYQVLCRRGADLAPFPGSFTPIYQSAGTNCPDLAPSLGTVESLDPAFVCSGALSVATSSQRVKILENGVTYGVAVVAVDRHGNASTPALTFGVPVASRDFYNAYRNDQPDPGTANGGFCSITTAGARVPGPLAVAALALLGVVLWRRARRGK